MAKITSKDIPFAISPGDTIREELGHRGKTVADLAEGTGLALGLCQGILDGTAAIDADAAARLGGYFGTSASMWTNLESQYREALAQSLPSLTDEAVAERQDLSGRFVVRVPKSLHSSLRQVADEEGVSLNLLVSTLLADGLGRRFGQNS